MCLQVVRRSVNLANEISRLAKLNGVALASRWGLGPLTPAPLTLGERGIIWGAGLPGAALTPFALNWASLLHAFSVLLRRTHFCWTR